MERTKWTIQLDIQLLPSYMKKDVLLIIVTAVVKPYMTMKHLKQMGKSIAVAVIVR